MPTPRDKAALRRQLRARRRQLSPRERHSAATALARALRRHPDFLRSRRIACYFVNDGEIDPALLTDAALKMGKAVYLPVLRPGRKLWFVRYRRGDPLVSNRFGIPEPNWRRQPRTVCWALDTVLMPLVAFDQQGNRLGMGGGFYDRTLAPLRQRRGRQPRLIGLAYHWQEVEQLPAAAWDIPLTGVATDRGYRALGTGAQQGQFTGSR